MSDDRRWSFPQRTWTPPPRGQARYLLLDGAQCEQPRALLEALGWPKTMLFDGLLASGQDDATVFLVAVPVPTEVTTVLQRLRPALRSPGALSVIDAALGLHALAERLRQRLEARYPNGKAFTARFFDARVLPWWVSILDDAQREAFLSVGGRWTFLDARLEWTQLGLRCPAHDPHVAPWVLQAEQRRGLIDALYPYTLMDHFLLTGPELLERYPRATWYYRLRDAVAAAEAHGITDSARLSVVASWALIGDVDLAEDPAWQQRLRDVGAGRRTVKQVGEEVWPLVESWDA